MKTIIKIQRPIVSSDPLEHFLIYNEDRSIYEQAFVERVLDLFDEDEFKIYHHAEINSDGVLNINERADEQDW